MLIFTEKHKEALRRHTKLHCHSIFPSPPAQSEGQMVVSDLFAGRKLAEAHTGVTHSVFIGVRDVSRCPREANLRP